MHMDMSQEAFYAEMFKENAVRVSRDAGEMHMDMSQEACGAEIDGKCQTLPIPPRLNTVS